MTFCNGIGSKSVYWHLEEERRRQKMSGFLKPLVSGPATTLWLPWGTWARSQWQNPSLACPPLFNYPSPVPSPGSSGLSAKTWRVHTFLQPALQPAALQSGTFIDNCCEFTINFCEGGFHCYPAVSIRPRSYLPGTNRCLMDFKREEGKQLGLFVFKPQKAEFSFFIVFASFKLRAWKMPLKWRMVAR